MSSEDPTLTFDIERLKMEQDNVRNEMAYLRRQIVKLNIKLVQHERTLLQNTDRLRHGAGKPQSEVRDTSGAEG